MKMVKNIFVRVLFALALVGQLGLQAARTMDDVFSDNFFVCKKKCKRTTSKKNIGIASSHLTSVSHAIACEQAKGSSYSDAAGIVGERALCRFFERGRYLCYASFMQKIAKKCCPKYKVLCRTTYNKRNGIDNIFIPVDSCNKYDESRPIIIAEAKYDNKCKLKLAKTACKCEQLSKTWIDRSITQLQNKVKKAKKSKNKQRAACAETAETIIEDIQKGFHGGNVIRIGSVLCNSSQLCLYLVHDRHSPYSGGMYHDTAIAEVTSNLPAIAQA